MDTRTAEQSDGGLWQRRSLYLLSWEQFDIAIQSLAGQVLAAGGVDCVLGISRGGLVPAVALSNTMGVLGFHVMAVGRNVGAGQYLDKQPPRILWQSDLSSIRGKRVLVVDDVCGSGETLRHVKSEVDRAGVAGMHTAVVVRMRRGTGAADFVAVELDDWVVFPWEGERLPAGARTRDVVVPVVRPEGDR